MAADGSWQDVCDTLGISIHTNPEDIADMFNNGDVYFNPQIEESPLEESAKQISYEEELLKDIFRNEKNLESSEMDLLRSFILERIDIEGGKWNGKIYGGCNQSLHIYIDNKKWYLKDYLNSDFLWGDYHTKLVLEIERERKREGVYDIDDEDILF
ncbi:MAG: hypothetical protein K2I63_00280 [Helicobacter sp.]|nr:hypothetical protein [Helicobacter sp.]